MNSKINFWFCRACRSGLLGILVLSGILIGGCANNATTPGNTTPGHPEPQVNTVERAPYGNWAGSRTIENILYNFQIRIEANKLTKTIVCRFNDGSELSASIAVAAEIGDNVIRVTESKTDQSQSGGKLCGVILTPRDIPYQLNANKLTVTNLNQGFTDELLKVD